MTNNIKFDGSVDIAVGKSRKQIKWKNEQWLWSELVEKLSKTVYTAETVAEYFALPKPIQDERKDIGGFVGGYLSQGKRSASTVAHRQLLTLDIDSMDNCTLDQFWGNFVLMYGCAACLYTTHKHTPDKPRFRLVIPLDREVFADEYVAIGRRVAGDLGIDYFDNTGFEPSRLMYWASTSKDGKFEARTHDGRWLCADDVLDEYVDWRDSSEWAVSDKYEAAIKRSMKKQGDPLEKQGIVGQFCRARDIHEVIAEFLSDVYTPTDDDNRYTYIDGSTAGGLVIYDDVFAYSHHGTDPCSGKLCNAFDLVRLHKFGIDDGDSRSDTPDNKLPSFNKMKDFAADDPKTRLRIGRERFEEVKGDFPDIAFTATDNKTEDDWLAQMGVPGSNATVSDGVAAQQEQDDSWLEQMKADRNGTFYASIDNLLQIFENDPYLKDRIGYDEFECREVALRDLAWRRVDKHSRYLVDTDVAHMRHYVEKRYGIASPNKLEDALAIVLHRKGFHPVRDYLKGVEWDGIGRLGSLFIDYLGAADNYYVREVTTMTFIAGVKRVFEPGCKYDHITVLVGAQGTHKSTIIRKMGMPWYSNSLTTVHGKEAYEQLRGVWIMEHAELAALNKAESEAVKNFIDKPEDRYRPAYGKRLENYPRQILFFGTSNTRDFLRDPTGARRFLPITVRVGKPSRNVFRDLTQGEIDQIWAEAYVLYREGHIVHISDNSELSALAKAEQSKHKQADDREGAIREYLDTLLPVDWDDMPQYQKEDFLSSAEGSDIRKAGKVLITKVCVPQIWCDVLGGREKDMNRQNTKPIHDIMRNMVGWEEGDRAKFKRHGLHIAYYRLDEKGERVKMVSTKVSTRF